MTTPSTPGPVPPNISRLRADSLGSLSLRGPPPNTPDTQSLINGFHSVDLDEVNEEIEKEADIRVGEPTLVPENTPFGSPPGSAHHGQLAYLPRIAERLEPLLELSLPSATEASSTAASAVEMNEVTRSSSPTQPTSGVPEHTDWATDIEGDLERDLARLANLALDDFQCDPHRSANDYYFQRLARFFQTLHLASAPPARTESTVTLNAEEINANAMVTTWAFNQLKERVKELEKKVEELQKKAGEKSEAKAE